LLVIEDAWLDRQVRRLLPGIPLTPAAPLRMARTPLRGALHAGSFLRERRIVVHCTRAEFPRIFVHELFHFAWIRLGNPARRAYETILAAECRAGARGELGWSAEWRKLTLRPLDVRARTRCWREYCCESFCDTAAWLYSGVAEHEEFTLARRFRPRRRAWFAETIEAGRLSI
jgi:hypothetical protein